MSRGQGRKQGGIERLGVPWRRRLSPQLNEAEARTSPFRGRLWELQIPCVCPTHLSIKWVLSPVRWSLGGVPGTHMNAHVQRSGELTV